MEHRYKAVRNGSLFLRCGCQGKDSAARYPDTPPPDADTEAGSGPAAQKQDSAAWRRVLADKGEYRSLFENWFVGDWVTMREA